ncbi:hypothetical protein G5714_016460 [Onychostoma macrolepis]|uniref:Uncharacterized protein n=1 Tax=Onychostoma macrolepis TaxID=369639 RepID=A0A7J6C8E3_9TELE|nr:hypothetical protein G5714_016460 [Onychostoma macrolepis]
MKKCLYPNDTHTVALLEDYDCHNSCEGSSSDGRRLTLAAPKSSTAQSAKDFRIGRHCLKPTAPQRRSQAAKDPVKSHLTQLPGPCSKDPLWHNRSSASSRSALTATGIQLCALPTAHSLHHQWKTSLQPD